MMSHRHRSFTHLFPVIVCLGVLLVTSTGCTNAAAAGLYTSAPTTLQATRIVNAFFRPMSPFQRTITDATAVQRLYNAAMKLPKAPSGQVSVNCPNDFNLHYQLRFLQNGSVVSNMDYNASGCQWLRISSSDSRITTPAFQDLLAQTLGLSKLT